MFGLGLLGNFVRSAFERKYGPELVTNGTFDSATGWTLASGWSIADGVLNTGGIANAQAYQSHAVTVGALYLCSFDVSNYVSGEVRFSVGAQLAGVSNRITALANGHYSAILTGESQSARFSFYASGTAIADIDNVSVKRVL